MKTMTYDDMAAVIARGEGVMYKGQVFTTVEQLPARSELASGNAEELAKLKTDLEAQHAKTQEELDKLQKALEAASANQEDNHLVNSTPGIRQPNDPAPINPEVMGATVADTPKAEAVVEADNNSPVQTPTVKPVAPAPTKG